MTLFVENTIPKDTMKMMAPLDGESKNCSSAPIAPPPSSIVVNGNGIETQLLSFSDGGDGYQSHISSSSTQPSQRIGHRRRRRPSYITMAGSSSPQISKSCSFLSTKMFVVAVVSCLLVGTASANVHRNLPLSTVTPPPSAQQQQPQQEQEHSNNHVVLDKRFVEGPLAAGLHVSGGSRLKRAARRVRRFRDVRSQLRMERRRGLPHDRKTPIFGVGASVAASATATPAMIYPPTATPQGPYGEARSVSTVDPSQHTYETSSTTEAPDVVPSLRSDEGDVVIEQELPTPSVQTTSPSSSLNQKAVMFMTLLAVQFGVQPMLVRKFMPQGICKSSVILTQELVKFAMAYVAYSSTTSIECRNEEISSLNFGSWLAMAGVPAILYTVQNLASLLAYQNLEALTFNVLNQTKILSAALCCYFVMGKKQTKMQSVSLILLLASALVMEKIISIESIMSIFSFGGGGSSGIGAGLSSITGAWQSMTLGRRFTHGVLPVLLASFISGLAGALVQRSLQGGGSNASAVAPATKRKPKNSYLFSMELTAASVVVLVGSLLFSSDGRSIMSNGFFHQWTPGTIVPILTNSIGGILVGLVTKHAGSVRKGFALIFGILLSGLLQAVAGTAGVSSAQIMGGVLAATSLWLHATHAPGKR